MAGVLVTGATGFIGRASLPFLVAQNYEVHAITTQPQLQSLIMPGVNWHSLNLLDTNATQKWLETNQPDSLLHLAWYAEPGKYWTSERNLDWVQASLNLLKTFVQVGGKRAVFAGTCAEYDWRYGFCSEQLTPALPATVYGTAKYSLQLLLNAFAQQTGLSAAWGRVFWLYGPYEHPGRLVASLCRNLLSGQVAPCSHGQQVRDFLHVEDVASAFVSLLGSEAAGVVNIGSGQAVQLKDIIYKIAEYIGKPELIKLGALAAPLNEASLVVADVKRLKQEVGWQPRYNLTEGLIQTVEWWKNYLKRENVT